MLTTWRVPMDTSFPLIVCNGLGQLSSHYLTRSSNATWHIKQNIALITSKFYLFFSSSSLLAFFRWTGISWARRSLASSLSFLAFTAESFVNWKVKEFPSWRTICICIFELPSGLIRWTVDRTFCFRQPVHKFGIYSLLMTSPRTISGIINPLTPQSV